jgi:hypothetical protein
MLFHKYFKNRIDALETETRLLQIELKIYQEEKNKSEVNEVNTVEIIKYCDELVNDIRKTKNDIK